MEPNANEALSKALRVYDSCHTTAHVDIACRYARLARRAYQRAGASGITLTCVNSSLFDWHERAIRRAIRAWFPVARPGQPS